MREEKFKPKASYTLTEVLWEKLVRILTANVKKCCEGSTGVAGTGPAGCPGHAGHPSLGHLNNYTKPSQAFDASLRPPHTAQWKGKTGSIQVTHL